MNTHESYVNINTALMLKKAGFDLELKTYYFMGELGETMLGEPKNHNISGEFISAPTLDVARKWLFSKGVVVWVEPCKITNDVRSLGFDKVNTEIWRAISWVSDDGHYVCEGHSYEEALENGIINGIQLLD